MRPTKCQVVISRTWLSFDKTSRVRGRNSFSAEWIHFHPSKISLKLWVENAKKTTWNYVLKCLFLVINCPVWFPAVRSVMDLISREQEKLKTSTAELSLSDMETLSCDINLPEGISPSDTKMKALKPVSSCNLRVGNPPEFQPPLSLSFSRAEWFFL